MKVANSWYRVARVVRLFRVRPSYKRSHEPHSLFILKGTGLFVVFVGDALGRGRRKQKQEQKLFQEHLS